MADKKRVSTLAQFWASVNYPLNTEDPLQHQQDEHDRLSDYSVDRTGIRKKKGPAIGGLLADSNPIGQKRKRKPKN